MANAKATAKKPAAKKPATPKAKLSIVPNATSFTVRDGVEIPARVRKGGASPYPFQSMTIGQSFFVAAPIVDATKYTDAGEAATAQAEECRKIANRLSGATRRFTKAHEGFKFAVRTTNDEAGAPGVGVWRVEQDVKA